jgi:polyhydroxybutyrate depolymerase
MRLLPLPALLAALLLLACSGDGAESDPTPPSTTTRPQGSPTAGAGGPPSTATLEATASPPPARAAALLTARPYTSVVPASYDEGEPAPLLLMLHGYGQGADFTSHLNVDMTAVAEAEGAILVYPLGTPDGFGRRHWNGTDACCDFFDARVDDVAYLAAVLDDVEARYDIDEQRVFVLGYSNGAFMAHRLACELAPRIAAIVAIAGVNWLNASQCQPSEPVAVLQVHGDADNVVRYLGGSTVAQHPSAQASIETWRSLNGCSPTAEGSTSLDLIPTLPGAETGVERYEGCRTNGAAELWTVLGATHDPLFGPNFPTEVWDFLSSHAKP